MMPFVAIGPDGRKHISYLVPELLFRQPWICPQCDESMLFVNCTTRIKHFRHRAVSLCEWEPESAEHLLMKRSMFEFFRRRGFRCQYEEKIGACTADLKVSDRRGTVWAIECQVSPISLDDYERRTDNYEEAGAIPLWVLYPQYYLSVAQCYNRVPCYRLKAIEREWMGDVLYFDKKKAVPQRLLFKPKWAKGRDGGNCSTLFFLTRREDWRPSDD